MADEGAPPSEPIEPGVEPTEPPEEPTEPIETPEPVEPEPPKQLSSDEIIEKAFQKTASWLGRRDQDLLQNVGSLIEEKIGKVVPQPEPVPSGNVFDDPDQWFQTKYQKLREVETQANIEYNNKMFRTAGNVMQGDSLFSDEELSKEVVEEVKKIAPTIDRRMPPESAGNLLVKDALVNVYRKRAQKKTNPLEKNTPVKTPLGTVTPPAPKPVKSKAPKLSPYASEMAKKWGYKEEDLKRVFGEG